MPVQQKLLRPLLERVFGRLRFPQLFALTAALFVVDLIVPDLLPFIDELLLGLATLMLGMWQREPEDGPRPPMKDVTPER